MAANIDSVTAHGRENKATYMINLFGSIIPLISFLVYASTQVSNLASETEVTNLIKTHLHAGAHPEATRELENVQGQLNSILANQIELRIEAQLKIICANSELRSALEPTVKQLIRDYNGVAKKDYERPSCIQLGVKQ